MLDPEELAEVQRLGGNLPAGPLIGDFVVTMGPAPIVLTLCSVVLVVVSIGLGSVVAAAAVGSVTLAAWLLRPRRVRRFRIDAQGQLWLGGHARAVVWPSVSAVTFAFRAPFAATERDKLYGTLAALSIVEAGTAHVFARGAVFQRAPTREPVLPYRVSDFFRGAAERAGLRVSIASATDWTAAR